MEAIEHLCWRLRNSWNAPPSERAELWRTVYRACPDVELERMHRIAFDYKLGAATGEEWIQRKEDVLDPEPQSLPHSASPCAIELRPYRGYGLQTTVEQHPDTTWSVRCSVQNPDWRTVHTFVLANCAAPHEAVRTGLRSAAEYVDVARETSRPAPTESATHLPGGHAWRPQAVRIVWLSDPTGAYGSAAAYRQRQHEEPRGYRAR